MSFFNGSTLKAEMMKSFDNKTWLLEMPRAIAKLEST
jgi:hypothetical protein